VPVSQTLWLSQNLEDLPFKACQDNVVRPCHKQVLVAHTYNPSYSVGRVQEDQGSKIARANSSRDTISKKSFTKKGWWSDSRCRP
jgi:hypothetical protein